MNLSEITTKLAELRQKADSGAMEIAPLINPKRRIDMKAESNKTETELDVLEGLLPHGSGIDYDWHIYATRTGYRCENSYHAMDGWGGYCCVNDFTAVVARDAAGKWDLRRVMLHDYNRHAHNYGLREYLEDTIYQSLRDA